MPLPSVFPFRDQGLECALGCREESFLLHCGRSDDLRACDVPQLVSSKLPRLPVPTDDSAAGISQSHSFRKCKKVTFGVEATGLVLKE